MELALTQGQVETGRRLWAAVLRHQPHAAGLSLPNSRRPFTVNYDGSNLLMALPARLRNSTPRFGLAPMQGKSSRVQILLLDHDGHMAGGALTDIKVMALSRWSRRLFDADFVVDGLPGDVCVERMELPEVLCSCTDYYVVTVEPGTDNACTLYFAPQDYQLQELEILASRMAYPEFRASFFARKHGEASQYPIPVMRRPGAMDPSATRYTFKPEKDASATAFFPGHTLLHLINNPRTGALWEK